MVPAASRFPAQGLTCSTLKSSQFPNTDQLGSHVQCTTSFEDRHKAGALVRTMFCTLDLPGNATPRNATLFQVHIRTTMLLSGLGSQVVCALEFLQEGQALDEIEIPSWCSMQTGNASGKLQTVSHPHAFRRLLEKL